MTPATDTWSTLARVVRPQGRNGEVLCDLLTDFPEQFTGGPALSLMLPDGERQTAAVSAYWMPTGRSAGRVVLKLAGCDSITAANLLRGAEVQVATGERPALESGTYYVTDLIGAEVWDGERRVGTVADLHFPQSSSGQRIADAASLFVVERGDGNEVMIPFASAYIESISVQDRRIVMRLPDGMVDMNG